MGERAGHAHACQHKTLNPKGCLLLTELCYHIVFSKGTAISDLPPTQNSATRQDLFCLGGMQYEIVALELFLN